MKKSTGTQKKVAAKVAPAATLPEALEKFEARARYVNYSPYKLRPIANVVRGKDVSYALNWLATYRTQRAEPIKKLLESAVANAKNKSDVDGALLKVKEIRVDGGPIHRYFKPGAQGRANIQRRRLCHVKIVLEVKP